MKSSFKNLFVVIMILVSLIGSSIQATPAAALAYPESTITLSLPTTPGTWSTGRLLDVWGDTSGNVYMAGYGTTTISGTAYTRPLIYKNSPWTASSPNLPTEPGTWSSASLKAVWGVSGDDIYMVGHGTGTISGNPYTLPVIYKKGTTAWNPTSPDLPGDISAGGWISGQLEDVWGSSASDVYAVGYGNTFGAPTKPIVYHSTDSGGSWTYSLPPLGNETTWNGFIYSIWGSANNDIYIVGYGNEGTTTVPLIYHSTNGTTWTQASLSLPTGWSNGTLVAVWGSAANDIYAVGYGHNGTITVPLMYHYDGSNWVLADSLPQAPSGWTLATLTGVWGSGGVVYLTGYGNDGEDIKPLMYRKTSSGWAATVPALETWESRYLEGMWGSDAYNMYLVGYGTSTAPNQPLLYNVGHDTTAPGAVVDLVATSGQAVGSVRLTWKTPADDDTNNDSGPVDSYIVRYSLSSISSCGAGSGFTTGLPAPIRPGAVQTMLVTGLPNLDTRYYFAVCAVDEEGNQSVAATANAKSTILAAGLYDDVHPNWIYSAGWTAWTGSGPTNNTEHYTGTVGASAQITFTGMKFIYTFTKHPNRGLIDVYIDGVKRATINAYSPTSQVRSTWTSPNLTADSHTVQFVHAGAAGKYIDVDIIEVLESVAVPAGTYDDTHGFWEYSASWTAWTGSGPANNTSHYTGTMNETATLMFIGTRFVLTYTKASSYGSIDVYVDGAYVDTINSYSPSLVWQATWSSDYYPLDTHVVQFKHAGPVGKYIEIDAIQIFNNPPPVPVGVGTYEDTNGNWIYSNGWSTYTGSGPSGNNSHYTRTVGAYAELMFTGVKFTVTYTKASSYGLIDVYVDGTKVGTINSYSSTLVWRATWSSPTLSAGTHTVRLVHAGAAGKYIELDAIQILDSAAVPAGTYDDADSNWAYSAGWSAYAGSGPLNNTSHYTGTMNNYAEITFIGTRFMLTFTKYSSYGLIDVYVDGTKVATIDSYSPTLVWKATWSSDYYALGTHTVRFVHGGAAGKYIELDAIQIMNNLPPTPVGLGYYEDTHGSWIYSSSWLTYTGSGPSGNNSHYTGVVGESAELMFTGVKFVLTYAKAGSYGLIDVYVDGTKVGTINSYSPTLVWRATWTSPNFGAGTHTLRLVHAGAAGKYIDIDAIEILDSTAVGVGTYDDADGNWAYSAGWTGYTASGPLNGTSHYAGTVGNYAEMTFTGTRFILTYAKASSYGSIDVYVDGTKVHTIDSYNSTLVWQATWSSDYYALGTHTVRFEHAGPAGRYIDLDAIQIFNNPPPVPVGVGTYEDTNSNWIYSAGWSTYNGSGPSNNDSHYTGVVGNSAEITFTGAKFILTYAKYPSYGLIDVYVDGTKVSTINSFSPVMIWRATWTSPNFGAGTHTVRLVHGGAAGKFIDIDAIQILDSAAVPPGNYDDTDSNWVYSAGWTTYNGSGPLNNTSHYTGTVDSYAELKFTGSRFILTFTKFSNYGSIDVYVDGVKVDTINSSNPTLVWRATWGSLVYASGVHTVRFVHAGPAGTYIELDSIEIQP